MENNIRKREYLREWRKKNRELNATLENDPNMSLEDLEIDQNNEQDLYREGVPHSDHSPISSGSETALRSESLSDTESSGTDLSLETMIEDNEINNDRLDMTDAIAKWILTYKISRSASNELLRILRENGHNDVPKCTRTVLQTPRGIVSDKKCGGDYIYLGIVRGIARTIKANPQHKVGNKISLVVNVDGVPLYKSSQVQAWPILCMFDKISPFIVAVFVGNSKPSNLEDFLHDFVAEYEILSEDGFEHNGRILEVEIKAFLYVMHQHGSF